MGQYFGKQIEEEEESFPSLVDLPDTAHREVFKDLKPWELYKLSRTSKAMRDSIMHNTNFSIKILHMRFEEGSISIRFMISQRFIMNWTFADIRDKWFWMRRFYNHCYYGVEYSTHSYHEDMYAAFQLALENLMTIFKVETNMDIGKLQVQNGKNSYSSQLNPILGISKLIGNHLSCDHLVIINERATNETERNLSMNLTRSILKEVHVNSSLELRFILPDGTLESEMIFQNPIGQIDDLFLANQLEDVHLNTILKKWMHFEMESIQSVRKIEKRKCDVDTIGKDLEIVRWDGQHWPEMRSFYLSGSEFAVMFMREDKRCAVVSFSELLGNGYTEFGVQFF